MLTAPNSHGKNPAKIGTRKQTQQRTTELSMTRRCGANFLGQILCTLHHKMLTNTAQKLARENLTPTLPAKIGARKPAQQRTTELVRDAPLWRQLPWKSFMHIFTRNAHKHCSELTKEKPAPQDEAQHDNEEVRRRDVLPSAPASSAVVAHSRGKILPRSATSPVKLSLSLSSSGRRRCGRR